jgi:hypothetical protein
MVPVYPQRIIAIKHRLARALGIEPGRFLRVEEWANCLFIVFRSAKSTMKQIARFVSYKSIQSLPTESGEYFMTEGDRRLRVEVDIFALDSELGLSTFLVRSIEKSPRTWEFHTLEGRLTRGFDWNGDLIPRCQLRALSFSPTPNTAKDAMDRLFASLSGKAPRARVRSEWEVNRG